REDGENTLISPLSVLSALAMTANGARGETLRQMESVLGMTADELNRYLYSYVQFLPRGDKYTLHLANSIWFTDDSRFTVEESFLQTNADYYRAAAYKAPFDNRTVKDINNWVKRETDGMIPKVLDGLSPKAVMYLVNALAFEAEWTKYYEKHQVRDAVFTKEDGTKQDIELMYSNEGMYLEDERATGFVKYYSGYKYAFAALLPNEGVTVDEYLASIDGTALSNLLSGAQSASVSAAIPKFESEYSIELSKTLTNMGMNDAFDEEKADFSGLGTYTDIVDYNIYINRVIHKTHIKVGEKGTKAGAVTVVEMGKADSASDPNERKSVCLDRPFVYMLIDCENNIPFFIGTVMDMD
ncbi:MAG: serpin family protein, partial [Clostridia bacterium]|nr:serpin family protein [Clostridia bacterium]